MARANSSNFKGDARSSNFWLSRLRPRIAQRRSIKKGGNVTLIGDARHPMSPFKGQGANQALLDALSLARAITKGCKSLSHWKKVGLRESVLNEFEAEMLKRSAVKVKDSIASCRIPSF
ncbi:FAD-dependent oxidoreductase [Flavobacterium sp. P21]|uniref:FAD-dependent oxidoreductase n=1 Tax=Flavobacterium sp. P21 TaxID=3423948 RepID=UPI003D6795C4